MHDKRVRVLASVGLAVGGVLGHGWDLCPIRVAWGIDELCLVMTGALLTLVFYRKGDDLVASGFLVFAIGEGIILSGAAMDLAASIPSFGAGSGLWAVALTLISIPRTFPFIVRALGLGTALLFAATALQIFAAVPLHPISSPLPFFAYPFFVATFFGWIWTLLKTSFQRFRSYKRNKSFRCYWRLVPYPST